MMTLLRDTVITACPRTGTGVPPVAREVRSVVKIRYAELPDGMHAQVQGSGRQTVIYLAPGLSPGQRAAALRRLIRASRRGHGPRLRRPAVCARGGPGRPPDDAAERRDRGPLPSGRLAGHRRAPDGRGRLLRGLRLGDDPAEPGATGPAGCPGHPAGHPRERGPAARVWAGPPRRTVRRHGRRARCLLGRGALPGRLRAGYRGGAVAARGQPNAAGHHLRSAALAERAAVLLGPGAGLSVGTGPRARPGLLVAAVRPSGGVCITVGPLGVCVSV